MGGIRKRWRWKWRSVHIFSLEYNKHERAGSSAGQSAKLIPWWSEVRVLPGPQTYEF